MVTKHKPTKIKSPQTNGICGRFPKRTLKGFFREIPLVTAKTQYVDKEQVKLEEQYQIES